MRHFSQVRRFVQPPWKCQNFVVYSIMAAVKAPKQWCLLKNENANSIEVWKDSLIFILNEDSKFAELLKPGMTWQNSLLLIEVLPILLVVKLLNKR